MRNSVKICSFFVFMIFLVHLSAVNLYSWYRHHGGTESDLGRAIQQTSDGGYIVAGQTASYTYGNIDIAIYRLDSNGNKVWFKHYGGTERDWGWSIQQTSEGGYVVGGFTESFTNGNFDIAIYKLDSSGSKTWFKHYGGTQQERCYSLQQTSDGGYIVGGYTASYTNGMEDFAIYKLDSNGNKVWFKHYGGTLPEYGRSICQTSDGGYVITGETFSFTNGNADYGIYKLDSSGNKQWFRHYGGSNDECSYSIQQTSDGGYIVAGYSTTFTNGQEDFAIYKLDSSGNKTWFKHYGSFMVEYCQSIDQTTDGGYIVVGSSYYYTHGSDDFAIYKLDSSGNKTWFKHYGGTDSDTGYFIQQISGGGYIVTGSSTSFSYGNNDFATYKLDTSGNK